MSILSGSVSPYEWKMSGGVTGEVTIAQSSVKPNGSIAADRVYVKTGPQNKKSLTCENRTFAELMALEALWGTSQTFTLACGNTITGYIDNVQCNYMDNLEQYTITVSLLIPYPGGSI